MKLRIFTMIGMVLLLTLGLDAAGAGGGLTTATTAIQSLKTTLTNLAKIVAGIGLIFIAIRYFMQQSEQRSIPWGWVIAAIVIGSANEILGLFNLTTTP